MAYRLLENSVKRLLQNGSDLLLEGPREIVIPYRTLENGSKRLFENSYGLLLETEIEMATLALINAALAAQGPASTAGAAIQAAFTADASLYADLSANGPAAVVDTTQTPPTVTLYAPISVLNPFATEIGINPLDLQTGAMGTMISTYTATPVRTAT